MIFGKVINITKIFIGIIRERNEKLQSISTSTTMKLAEKFVEDDCRQIPKNFGNNKFKRYIKDI